MAAIMNPQFMNFCFPGSAMDGGLLGQAEKDDDYKETTRELLSFMDSASSNIKLALDKPVKSKRKVNHRKYLQKQIKRCTGIANVAADAAGKGPGSALSAGKTVPKRDGVQASLQNRSLAALFSPAKETVGEKARKPPLRHRNLPPSFFTEPANCSKVDAVAGMSLRDLERANTEAAADFFELLGPDYVGVAAEQELYQSVPCPDAATGAGSYDGHHFVGGLLYPESWTSCSPPLARKLPTPTQPPLYCHPEAAAPVEDNALCSLAFSNFFTDCSIPQVNFDLSSDCNRTHYSSL
ncbi:protein FAM181B [Festucalex cinctus]